MSFIAEKKFFFNVCLVSILFLGYYWIGQKVGSGFKPKQTFCPIQYQNTEIKVHTYTVPGLKLPESLKGKSKQVHMVTIQCDCIVHTGYCGSIDEVMVPDWNDPGK